MKNSNCNNVNLNSAKALKTTLGCFPTGVTVVTTVNSSKKPIGLTVNSFNSLSLDPPLILWSLKRNSMHLHDYLNAKGFVINILSANQKNVCINFSQAVNDRFEGIDWFSSIDGFPVISNSAATLECETEACHEGGDHLIFIGRVKKHRHSERDPLIFFKGQISSCNTSSES